MEILLIERMLGQTVLYLSCPLFVASTELQIVNVEFPYGHYKLL